MVPLVDPNVVKPGWTAAIIVLVLIGATFFLWRNMGKQLKKIDFEEIGRRRPDGDPAGSADHTDHPDHNDAADDRAETEPGDADDQTAAPSDARPTGEAGRSRD